MCTCFAQKSVRGIATNFFLAVELRFISKKSFGKFLKKNSLFRLKGLFVILNSGSSISLKSESSVKIIVLKVAGDPTPRL